MTAAARGKLIVFEGVEGAGKSTQIERLSESFVRAGVDCRIYREPGGTILGDGIRELLLNPDSTLCDRAEALLFMASRAELVHCELKPWLEKGSVILLDRFFLSTYAYQIAGRGLTESDVRSANTMATAGLVPDLTLLLTLPADVGLARAKRRSGPDRIEQAGDEFYARVEEAFASFATREWQLAHEESGPIVAVDANGEPSLVENRVHNAVTARFADLRDVLGATA